jgi:hypothetical protein
MNTKWEIWKWENKKEKNEATRFLESLVYLFLDRVRRNKE